MSSEATIAFICLSFCLRGLLSAASLSWIFHPLVLHSCTPHSQKRHTSPSFFNRRPSLLVALSLLSFSSAAAFNVMKHRRRRTAACRASLLVRHELGFCLFFLLIRFKVDVRLFPSDSALEPLKRTLPSPCRRRPFQLMTPSWSSSGNSSRSRLDDYRLFLVSHAVFLTAKNRLSRSKKWMPCEFPFEVEEVCRSLSFPPEQQQA